MLALPFDQLRSGIFQMPLYVYIGIFLTIRVSIDVTTTSFDIPNFYHFGIFVIYNEIKEKQTHQIQK